GMIGGHVGEEAILLARRGNELFAIGSTCSHYGGPVAEGLMIGENLGCPWEQAPFCPRTGERKTAPAFNPLPCRPGDNPEGRAFAREKIAGGAEHEAPARSAVAPHPDRVVIVGGGAAGFAAAEMLRREGFAGSLTMVSSDDAAPYDRPNCSKDYLGGNAPEE